MLVCAWEHEKQICMCVCMCENGLCFCDRVVSGKIRHQLPLVPVLLPGRIHMDHHNVGHCLTPHLLNNKGPLWHVLMSSATLRGNRRRR